MTYRGECLEGREGVVLLSGLSGKLTLSGKNLNEDLKAMMIPRGFLEGGHSGWGEGQVQKAQGRCLPDTFEKQLN